MKTLEWIKTSDGWELWFDPYYAEKDTVIATLVREDDNSVCDWTYEIYDDGNDWLFQCTEDEAKQEVENIVEQYYQNKIDDYTNLLNWFDEALKERDAENEM